MAKNERNETTNDVKTILRSFVNDALRVKSKYDDALRASSKSNDVNAFVAITIEIARDTIDEIAKRRDRSKTYRDNVATIKNDNASLRDEIATLRANAKS